ncbi:MAG: hypothetical protein EOL88_06390 [Bacteroidia bacterium]|nr:hypothetical protein [Bacteroidia bacterium]
MIRIKVWHNTILGDINYPVGYFDEYLFNAEIREESPLSERIVVNVDGRDIVQSYTITHRKKTTIYVDESYIHLIRLIPMYKYIEIYDNDVIYSDIYNIELSEDNTYNNGSVIEIKLTFAYKNYISRNSAI